MRGIRVALSSGDVFFVDADLKEVAAALRGRSLVKLGERFVNAAQVAQLTVEMHVSTIHTLERLED